MNHLRRTVVAAVLAGCAGLLFWAAPAVDAGGNGEKAKGKPPVVDVRPGLGQNASTPGALLVCPADRRRCEVLRPRAVVYPGDLLVALPGSRADVNLADGRVRLSLLGAYPKGPDALALPSGVRVNAADGAAFDLTLDGGWALLAVSADKGKGVVKGRVRFGKEVLHLELLEPGTEVALELLSHWPPRAPFVADPKPDHRPVADAAVLLAKGEFSARLNDGPEQVSGRGRALIHWNSERGIVGPIALKELPPWVQGEVVPDKAARAAAGKFQQRLAKQGLANGLEGALTDKDAGLRVIAAHALGAVDDLPGLLRALGASKHADVRRAAAAALRHRSGRSAADDVSVYRALLADKYKPAHAEMVMDLLRTFDEQALAAPATYQTLIQYLTHDRPAVRELAAWHLYQLVPQGQSIAYDSAAVPAELARAQAAWRKLIPAGRLPPPPPKEK